MPEDKKNIIKATPTKDFFIFMLVRDIDLISAIAELVDNSVDGAERLRGPSENYNGLWVSIEMNGDLFQISDNCGGISVEMAREHAFRFGRAHDVPENSSRIGVFGVGMKRALLKMGNYFEISSKTSKSFFNIKLDVLEWSRDKDKWDFEFDEFDETWEPSSDDELGTVIKVTKLHRGIAGEFELENFKTNLANRLERQHQSSLDKGLAISINGNQLRYKPAQLLSSDVLEPTFKESTIVVGEDRIYIKIYAGLGKSEPSQAGWYVYCNGRMILEADKTSLSGWGDGNPLYHPEFAMFRGYTYFFTSNPKLLPWNTTKNGIDASSDIYRTVRLEMIAIMRTIIDFINKLDKEKEFREKEDVLTPLERSITSATLTNISDIREYNLFRVKVAETERKKPDTGRIQYNKPIKDINILKRVLGATSNKEVGEKTFEYVLNMESGD